MMNPGRGPTRLGSCGIAGTGSTRSGLGRTAGRSILIPSAASFRGTGSPPPLLLWTASRLPPTRTRLSFRRATFAGFASGTPLPTFFSRTCERLPITDDDSTGGSGWTLNEALLFESHQVSKDRIGADVAHLGAELAYGGRVAFERGQPANVRQTQLLSWSEFHLW